MKLRLIVALTLLATRAHAGIGVEVEGCGSLDVAEIERLVALEVASVVEERGDAPFPPARVTCAEQKMRIVIDDPVTEKHLERSLPAPRANEKGRERTFALAISQLYLTSWMELVMKPPPLPVGPPKDAPGAKAARATVKKLVVSAPPSWSADAMLGAALRMRGGVGLDDVGGTFRATAYSPSGFGAFALASYENMRVSRARGDVDATLASIGIGAAYRSNTRGLLAFDARAGASLVFARLDGRAANEGVIASGGNGSAVDLGVALGPTLLLGPFRVGVEGQAGLLVPRVIARVRDEEAVKLHGLWLGAAVNVGLGFGGS